MADIYDRAKALAARQLAPRPAGKGAPLTLEQRTAGDYVPGGGTTGGGMVLHLGSGVRVDYKVSDIDGVNVINGDFQLLVSPLKIDGSDMPQPQVSDVFTFNGDPVRVIRVMPWNYAGLAVGYRVQVRK